MKADAAPVFAVVIDRLFYRYGAVGFNGHFHAVLNIIKVFLAETVDCGHRLVGPNCGEDSAGSGKGVDVLREEHTGGVLSIDLAQ